MVRLWSAETQRGHSAAFRSSSAVTLGSLRTHTATALVSRAAHSQRAHQGPLVEVYRTVDSRHKEHCVKLSKQIIDV